MRKSKLLATPADGNPTLMHAFAVLAVSIETGPDPHAIAARTGIDIEVVRRIAERMYEAGLWGDNGVSNTELYDAAGEINAKALFGQAQLAAGLARRVATESGVQYVPLIVERETEPEAQDEEVEE